MAATLKVSHTPQYISVDEFARIFAQLEGYQTCRLMKGADGDPIGYVEFNNAVLAEKARGIYNDWQGWGPKGLLIEFAPPPAEHSQGGAKRGREELQGDPGVYNKQQRTDQPASMGYGSVQPVKAEVPNGSYGVPTGQLPNGGAVYDPSSPNPNTAGSYVTQPAGGPAAGSGPYAVAQPAAGQQTAASGVSDPRYGVPPRIPAGHQGTGYVPTGQDGQYVQPQLSASPQAQFPSQGPPAAAQPTQYAGGQAQYPSQQQPQPAAQQPQYGTAPAQTQVQGQYGSMPAGGGQAPQQPMQQQQPQQQQQGQYGNAPAAGQTQWAAAPVASQYGAPAPNAQGQYGVAQQQPSYQPVQQPMQQQPAQQQPQPQQQYMAMPQQQQVAQQAPQQPPANMHYAPQQGAPQYAPQQGGGPQQQPPMQVQMQQPAPVGQAPGPVMQQGPPLQQGPPMQMQYAQPAQGAPAAQYPPARMDQMGPPGGGPYRDGPPRYDERPPDAGRGPPMDDLPHDACSTIYVDGLPLGATKRELAHVFRPFDGFMELRLIHKTDKSGREIVIAFAEFSDMYTATSCMRLLQNYPWDLDAETSPVLRLSYARPPKSLQERARGGGDRGPPRGPLRDGPSGGGRRPTSSSYTRDEGSPRDRRTSGFSDGPAGGRGNGAPSQSRGPSRAAPPNERGPRAGGRGGRF